MSCHQSTAGNFLEIVAQSARTGGGGNGKVREGGSSAPWVDDEIKENISA